MVDPRIMCRQHLLGEHREIHMIIGNFRKNRSITGYIQNNCIEPMSIMGRHFVLINEMYKRGYTHTTPINPNDIDISYLPLNEQIYAVNDEQSLKDLISRCPECAKRHKIIQ